MPAELLDQLDAYGRFLEAHAGQSLSAPSAPAADELAAASPLHPIVRPIRSRRPVWTAAAALLVALAGVVGAVAIVRHTPAAVVDEPVDPADVLFVLPDPDAGYHVSSGWLEDAPDEAVADVVIGLVGRRNGLAFVDLVQINVGVDLTQPVDAGTESSVSVPRSHAMTTPGGRSVQVLDYPVRSLGVRVVTEYGSTVVSFAGGEGHLDDVLTVVDDVVFLSGGSPIGSGTASANSPVVIGEGFDGATTKIALDDGSSFSVVSSGSPVALALSHSVGYEVTSPERIGLMSVETVTWLDSTILLGWLSDRIERTTVAGVAAWIVTRGDPSDEEGPWRGLVWVVSGGTIAVSGYVPEDELRSLADQLEVVDADTWFDALPYARPPDGESPCTSAATC